MTNKIKWTVSDDSIASIDAHGKIYGKKVGTCIITAEMDSFTETSICVVKGNATIKDLSENGYANCYMAKSRQSAYGFYPSKGNTVLINNDISSVVVLWESYNNNRTPSAGSIIDDVKYDSSMITFNTKGSGNAVIAAKNAAGNIIWSWHIWVTDYTPDKQYDTYKSGAKMMDRNLGALSNAEGAIESVGLFYQWGRKDPMLGADAFFSSTRARSCPANIFTSVASSNTTGNIDYSIAHPTTFIREYSGDWLYVESNNDRWSKSKTMYDPCPAGWKVPQMSVWNHFNEDYLDFRNWGLITRTDMSDHATWYPQGGFITTAGSISESGDSGRLWSSGPVNNDGLYSPYYSGNWFYIDHWANRTDGRNVRCVKE